MSRLFKSFSYAFNGLKICFREEANFKIHISCSIAAIIFAAVLHIGSAEWMIILLCIGFVLCMEMINTAIEKLCNVVHKETHPGIKVTKDIAAGAVLLSAIIAATCAVIIFIPKIFMLLKSTS